MQIMLNIVKWVIFRGYNNRLCLPNNKRFSFPVDNVSLSCYRILSSVIVASKLLFFSFFYTAFILHVFFYLVLLHVFSFIYLFFWNRSVPFHNIPNSHLTRIEEDYKYCCFISHIFFWSKLKACLVLYLPLTDFKGLSGRTEQNETHCDY